MCQGSCTLPRDLGGQGGGLTSANPNKAGFLYLPPSQEGLQGQIISRQEEHRPLGRNLGFAGQVPAPRSLRFTCKRGWPLL